MVRKQWPAHYSRPVRGFGARRYGLLIVGLAPGLQGANRTGRPFTGDDSGTVLFRCLHRAGIASTAASLDRRDGMTLFRTRVTNVVKCLPPANRPTGEELRACAPYLRRELDTLGGPRWVIALGALAHRALLYSLDVPPAQVPFGHGSMHRLGKVTLLDSYHCSRLNMNTGRLTEDMLRNIIDTAAQAIRTR